MTQQSNNTNNDQGFTGVGTPYWYPEDDPTRVMFFGNPVKLEIAKGSEKKVRESRKKENPGAALTSKEKPKPDEVTIVTDTFQPLTWAMAVMGTAAKLAIQAKTIADKTIKARLSGYYPIGEKYIDPDTVQLSKSGVAIDKTAYELNPVLGLIQITDDSVASDDDDLTINFATLKKDKLRIEASKVSSFRGKLVVDGFNDAEGNPAELVLPNVSLAFDGSIDWYNDGFNEITMKGTAMVGKKGESPYYIDLLD